MTETTILTVDGKSWETLEPAGELEILGASGCREACGLVDGGLRDGNNLGAVDQAAAAVAEDGQLGHRGLEAVRHELLLVDESLPEACSALVASKGEVGLETHLAGVVAAALGERRGHFTGVVVASGEPGALEQDFEEDLSVERERGLVTDDR